jgi:vacuolar-type H+-ATPase subunit C/Vma6
MNAAWLGLVARSRGLAARLLDAPQLERLARAADIETLAAGLVALGLAPATARPTAEALDAAVRRAAAASLAVLERWRPGDRRDPLALALAAEDRRSVRALLRGAVAGVPAPERLAGLVPTPSLTERALAELARQSAPGAVAALLLAWGHPYGPDLIEPAAGPHPDLYALERALAGAWALRLVAGAGDAETRRWARREIDLENTATALLLARRGDDRDPARAFLAGGERLTEAAFHAAIAAGERSATVLARALAGEPIGRLLARGLRDPALADFEHAALLAHLAAERRRARRAPLGAAPVIAFLLGVRAQVVALARLVWAVALGAPPAARRMAVEAAG